MPLGMEVGLGPGHIVRDRDPAPPQKGSRAPPNVRPLSMSVVAKRLCIRIPLGMEVSLSLGDVVLDGDPAPPPVKGHNPPIFSQCPLWPNGWMD